MIQWNKWNKQISNFIVAFCRSGCLKFTIYKKPYLLKPVLGGVGGSLHFTLPSMNRLNQTEPATFAILLFWAFYRGSFFPVFVSTQDYCICTDTALSGYQFTPRLSGAYVYGICTSTKRFSITKCICRHFIKKYLHNRS